MKLRAGDKICPFCNKKIDAEWEFDDVLSKIEFRISGLCQACQDKTFNNNSEEQK